MEIAGQDKRSDDAVIAREPAHELLEWLRETWVRTYRGENAGILIAAMFVIIAIFAVMLRDTAYLSTDNFLNIVRQTTVISIMAIATVFVISAGEIDLSIAAVIPLAGYWLALVQPHYGIVVGVLAALGFGAGVGLVNGLITVLLRVPSFVVTLGMLGFLEGLAMVRRTVRPSSSTTRRSRRGSDPETGDPFPASPSGRSARCSSAMSSSRGRRRGRRCSPPARTSTPRASPASERTW